VNTPVDEGSSVRVRISLGAKNNEASPKPVVPVAAPPTASSLSWATYRDNQRGWALDYPAGWSFSQKQYADGRTRLEFKGPQPDVSIILDYAPDTSGMTPLGSWQDMDSRYRRAYKSRYQLLGLSESPLGGQPGARWEFTLRNKDGVRLRKIDRGTTYNGIGYALLLVAPVDEFGAWQSVFDHVYLSFHF
jgi:hypothetical protein